LILILILKILVFYSVFHSFYFVITLKEIIKVALAVDMENT